MSDAKATSYANAWLALLPQVHLPTIAAQAVARECAKYANWTTGQDVRPTRKRLAWNLNTSQDTVKVAVGVCVAHGILKPVTKGGVRGPVNVAAVYCLSVPEHLATPKTMATFPEADDVVVVRPKVVSGPKYPTNNPDDDPSVGSGLPAEIRSLPSPNGEQAPRAVGSGLPAQQVAGSPPPSIDPPGILHGNPAADAASQPPETDASRQAAADADGDDAERMPPSAAYLAARAALGRPGDWGTAGGRTGSDLGKQGPKGMPSPLPDPNFTAIQSTGESSC